MKKVIITVDDSPLSNDAGPKAKVDVDYFINDLHFEVMHQYFDVHSKVKKLLWSIFAAPFLFKGENYDEILFQYPMYSIFMMNMLIPKMKQHTKKLFFIIHDVESLRMMVGDNEYLNKELKLLNMADGLIVHNEKMANWLKNHGIKVNMVYLKIFDYDNPQPMNIKMNYNRTVCFAGNLSKSPFLDKLSLNSAKLNIYGSYPSESYGNGLYYQGVYSPDELPAHLKGDFGLVWDGASVDTCDGNYGNYLRYNDPHKTSLYLSSGIPVIIWDQAALANFIEDNGLGIAISSLNQLDEVLQNLTKEEYSLLKQNAIKMGNKLREGYFSKNAIKKLEKLE